MGSDDEIVYRLPPGKRRRLDDDIHEHLAAAVDDLLVKELQVARKGHREQRGGKNHY